MERILKKNVYVCITELFCCTAEISTALYINYTLIKKKSYKSYTLKTTKDC